MNTRLIVASLAMLIGCSDSTGPITGNIGELTFTFTGGGGGSFLVTGAAPNMSSPTATASDWALGTMDNSAVQTVVFANKVRTGGRSDLVLVGANRITVGSSPIEDGCDPETDACSAMILFVNMDSTGDTYDYLCALVTGTIEITEVSGSRMKGTFSGTGECLDFAGSAPTAFTVTSGTFNVPIIANAL